MADVTLYPLTGIGMVTPNQNTVKPPSDVGPAAWEPPDETYTEIWVTTRPTGPPFFMLDVTYGFWDAYAGRIDDVVPFARIEALRDNTTLNSTSAQFQAIDTADSGSPFVGWFFPYGSPGNLPAIDTIFEVAGDQWVWQDQDGGSDKTRLISVLRAGTLEIQLAPPLLPGGWTVDGMSWGFRVHEFGLVVSTRSTVAPPCHLYPRDDNQGVGGGAIWPPPSSGRPGSYY